MSSSLSVTATGIDEDTDVDRAAKLNCEIGILYSATNAGPRYPRLEWIKEVVVGLDECAIHICGSKAKRELLEGDLDSLIACDSVYRVQINGEVFSGWLASVTYRFPGVDFITQWNDRNRLLEDFESENHNLLVDSSGGRGIKPDYWSAPKTAKRVGFAGGIYWANIRETMEMLLMTGRKDFWIDAEGKLRTEDRFDIEKAEAYVAMFEACCKGFALESRLKKLEDKNQNL